MKKILVFAFFGLMLQLTLVSAVLTPQETVTYTIEAGRVSTFQLVIQNTEASTEELEMHAEGQAEDWIAFGEERDASYTVDVPPYSTVFLPVTIAVPVKTETKEYKAEILADEITLMELNLRVVPPLDEIKSNERTSLLLVEIEELKQDLLNISSDIGSELASGNQELNSKILELSRKMSDIQIAFEQEKRDLEGKISNLDGLTGNIAMGSTVTGFVVGIVVAVLGILAFGYRKNLLNVKVRKKKKEPKRYEFTRPQE